MLNGRAAKRGVATSVVRAQCVSAESEERDEEPSAKPKRLVVDAETSIRYMESSGKFYCPFLTCMKIEIHLFYESHVIIYHQNTQLEVNECFLIWTRQTMCTFSANVAVDKATNRYRTQSVENT